MAPDSSIQDALAGDREAMARLVERLTPVIASRVMRVVRMGGHRTPDQVRQIADDLTQEIFITLIENDGRALRRWEPTRGLSLEGYVGLLATNTAVSLMRSGRKSAAREDATDEEALSRVVGAAAPESPRLYARDTLARLLPRLCNELSDAGVMLLELLIVEARSIEEVSTLTGHSPAALYAWRSRITRAATRIAAELDPASSHRERARSPE